MLTWPTPGFHGRRVGAALDGALRCAGGGHTVRQLPPGMVEGGSALGVGQTPDHRGSDLPAEGLLLPGAPPRQDVGRFADASGGQGRGLHLRPNDKRLPWSPVAPSGGPADLAHYTSVVLELRLCELRRITLPRTSVNKGSRKGRWANTGRDEGSVPIMGINSERRQAGGRM